MIFRLYTRVPESVTELKSAPTSLAHDTSVNHSPSLPTTTTISCHHQSRCPLCCCYSDGEVNDDNAFPLPPSPSTTTTTRTTPVPATATATATTATTDHHPPPAKGAPPKSASKPACDSPAQWGVDGFGIVGAID